MNLSNPFLVFPVGMLVGWMASKVLTGYLWAKKREACLRWLNKNSKTYGFAIDDSKES